MPDKSKTYNKTSGDQGAWRPSVLILDDEWATLERLKSSLSDEFDITTASRVPKAREAMEQGSFDVVLSDMRMPEEDGLSLVTELKERYPETQYILMTAFSDIEDTIRALRLGVADYLRKPFSDGEVRHALHRCLEERRLRQEVARLLSGANHSLREVITHDQNMLQMCRLAETVARTDVTILISGETGTGKGLLARAIHQISHRAEKLFVEIDCGGIPPTLIESELFGHERGAFTGAVARKPGRVESATDGTLLLDEIGEMPLDMQVKLLRFLQNRTFERVGGTKSLVADVRVIAATNRELAQAVNQGLFRQDLYYRLNVIHLHIPPLRERPGDIPLLAEHFLKKFAVSFLSPARYLAPAAKAQLMGHHWPGNVRELEHTMERTVLLTQSETIQEIYLATAPSSGPESKPLAAEPLLGHDLAGMELNQYLAECEKKYLKTLLARHLGRVGDSAKTAGVNPKTLYLKMNRHGLRRQDYRPLKNREPE